MVDVAIVPAGAWGTALAVPLAAAGHRVRLWSRRPEFASSFNASRTHLKLPSVMLPASVQAVSGLADAVAKADLLVLAPASQGLRATCRQVAPYLSAHTLVLLVTKGLEPGSLLRMSQVVAQELPAVTQRLAVLSGPNFALEVAMQLPTTTVVASADPAVASQVQELLITPSFRVYTAEDLLGVELGGALKNVIALAVGISDGLGMGQNARAALITRGLAEMGRLGAALGANPLTFTGLSGLGDLVLTCTGDLSRNRQAGLAVGRGQKLEAFLRQTGMVVEGVPTTRAAWALAQQHNVDMPITGQLYQVLFTGKPARDGVAPLMTRLRTHERDLTGRDPAY